MEHDNALGSFLRDRRARLDPAALGFEIGRRRTPGLRREEVAQRAAISPTWYTWLEQGRGGAPSADVLDRLSKGLMLTAHEREHLYLLALGHPPESRYRATDVTSRLQNVLDAMPFTPATIRSATWDVLAWNRAAQCLFTDYARLPAHERNILRLIFCVPRIRAAQDDWLGVARHVVASFRADAARAGASAEIECLVAELKAASSDFARLWAENDVAARGEGRKRLYHAVLGPIELAFSEFAVDARPDLIMTVYHPVAEADAMRLKDYMTRERS